MGQGRKEVLLSLAGRQVRVSNPDKIYFPALGLRKLDVVNYYLAVQDLILPAVEALGRRLEGIEITALEDGVFQSVLVFDQDTRLAARPSDALAIAVRDGLPIAVADEILDEVGQRVSEMFPNGVDIHEPPDRQVAAFREFIEEVSPDDFGSPSP